MEKNNSIIFNGKKWKLIGPEMKLGDKVSFSATAVNFEEINLDKLKKTTVFSVFPSISTNVCDEQTVEINKLAKEYPNLDFIALSVDLPTTLADWCGAHGVKNIIALSDYKNRDFGKKYGFLIDNLYLLNRGVFILDINNKVIYLEKKEDIEKQIDFKKLNDFLKSL